MTENRKGWREENEGQVSGSSTQNLTQKEQKEKLWNGTEWNPAANEEQMELLFESNSRNEGFARVAVAAFMTRMNPTLEETDDVKTAVSEAVTNSIIHGYAKKPGLVRVRVCIREQVLEVIVEDKGCGIEDIEKAMEPMYSGAPGAERSGMGFCFMEAFMDDLQVESKVSEGTIIRMKKNIGKGNEEEQVDDV